MTGTRRASPLLHEIISNLDPDLSQQSKDEVRVILLRDYSLEPGIVEFHGQAISCLVRSLSEQGAVMDVICARAIPDWFTLELPLEGVSYKCHLMWRRDGEIGVNFQSWDEPRSQRVKQLPRI